MQKPDGILVVVNIKTSLFDFLTSEYLLSQTCNSIARDLGLTVLGTCYHKFPPYNGVTVQKIIAESSLCIHTWPEFGYARLLVDSCKKLDRGLIETLINKWFHPDEIDIQYFKW